MFTVYSKPFIFDPVLLPLSGFALANFELNIVQAYSIPLYYILFSNSYSCSNYFNLTFRQSDFLYSSPFLIRKINAQTCILH
jgi:hypothetical protein